MTTQGRGIAWLAFALVLLLLFGADSNGLAINNEPLENPDILDNFLTSNNNGSESNNSVRVDPLDSSELLSSASKEEEELKKEIIQSEKQLADLLEAEKELQYENENSNKSADSVKEKAVENLMRIFGLTDSQTKSSRPGGPAPEFMIELYNTITDSSGITRAKNPYGAHIVRSFLERDHSLDDFFYFNVSLAGAEREEVLEAELHLYRIDTPRTDLHPSLYLNPFYVLSLYQVTDPSKLYIPDLHKLLAVQYVPALGSGWQVFNVKKAVTDWLSGHSENHGFLISAESVHGTKLPVRFARRGEITESKQPILVLFNNDTEAANSITPPVATGPVATVRKRVPKISSKEAESEQYTYEDVTTPLSSLENPQFHHSLLFQDSIRHPNSASRFRSRRSRNDTGSLANERPQNVTTCSLHSLFVSFEAIGWSSWIISPKGYNAHYCEGPCLFPLGKTATNHATVQSIINELNLSPGLGRPCCVPSKLLPISLLYYDDDDNVVLKQYVDMVAESCGCQ